MKYRAIEENLRRYPVRLMCRVLAVSPAGPYAWRERPASQRAQHNRGLLVEIRVLHAQSRRTYASPRITHDLRAGGHRVSENRVARLVRAEGIRAKTMKKWRATTDSGPKVPVAANTRNRQFTVNAPNRVCAGDISYCGTEEGGLSSAGRWGAGSPRISRRPRSPWRCGGENQPRGCCLTPIAVCSMPAAITSACSRPTTSPAP